jgi:phospholipid-binding lipoprotein MlaA
VLPVLGPSTLRDTFGLAGDYFLDPVEYVSPWELELGLDTLNIINRTSFRIGDYERLKEAAIDPYSAFRNAYIQHRRMQINQ